MTRYASMHERSARAAVPGGGRRAAFACMAQKEGGTTTRNGRAGEQKAMLTDSTGLGFGLGLV